MTTSKTSIISNLLKDVKYLEEMKEKMKCTSMRSYYDGKIEGYKNAIKMIEEMRE